MAQRDLYYRFSAKDVNAVNRAIDSVANDNEKAYNRIQRASAGTSKSLSAVNTVSREAQNNMRRLAQDAGTVGAVLSKIGPAGLAAAAGIGAFTLVAGRAVGEAKNFGTAMAEVSTLLPNGQDMAPLSDAIKDISRQFGAFPTDQAKATYQIISAGAEDAAQAIAILTASNKLAIGGVTDVTIAADGLTSVLNAYGDQIASAGDASDTFFVGVKAGKTTVEELATSIGKVSPLAAQVGVSFEEVVATIAALTKQGISTAESVTGLRAVLAAVAKPTKEATDLAADLGLQFNTAALESQGLAGFLEQLREKTGGNTDALAKLFGGVEALIPVMALTGKAGDDLNAILADMANKAGAADEATAKFADDANQVFKTLKADISVAAIELGDSLLTVIVPAAQALHDNLDTVGDTAEIVAVAIGSRLVASLGMATIAFGKSTVNAIGYQAALLRMSGASLTAAGALGVLRTAALGASAAFGGPLGLALTAAAGALYYFNTRATAAEESAERFNKTLDVATDLSKKLKNATDDQTGSLKEQYNVLLMNARANLVLAKAEQERAIAKAKTARRLFGDGGAALEGPAGEAIEATGQAYNELKKLEEIYADATKKIEENSGALGENTGETDTNTDTLKTNADTRKAAIASINEQIRSMEEELLLLRTGAADREALEAIMQAENAARKANIELTDEQRQKITDLADAIEAERAAQEAAKGTANLFADAAEDLGDRLVDSFRRGEDAGEMFKNFALDMFAELARAAVVQVAFAPIATEFAGALFGKNVASEVGKQLGVSGGGAGIGDALSLGSLATDLPSIGNLLAGNIGGFSTINQLGAEYLGTGLVGQGSVTGVSLSGVGLNAGIGGLAAGVLGLNSGNMAVDSIASLAGSYGGSALASAAGLGSFAGPAGIVGALALSAVAGGLFGGSRPHPASVVGAGEIGLDGNSAAFDATGNLQGAKYGAKHISDEFARGLAASVEQFTQALATGTGLDFSFIKNFSAGVDDGTGFYSLGNYKEFGDDTFTFNPEDAEEAQKALAQLGIEMVRRANESADVLDTRLARALEHIEVEGRSAEQVLADLSLATEFDKLFEEAAEPLSQTQQVVEGLKAETDRLTEAWERLGGTAEEVAMITERFQKQMGEVLNGYNQTITDSILSIVSPATLELRQINAEYEKRLEDLQALNATEADYARLEQLRQLQINQVLEDNYGLQNDALEVERNRLAVANDMAGRFANITGGFSDLIYELQYGRFTTDSPVDNLDALRQLVKERSAEAQLGDAAASEELLELIPAFLTLSADINGYNKDFAADQALALSVAEGAKSVAERQLERQTEIAALAEEQIGVLQQGFAEVAEAASQANLMAQIDALNNSTPFPDYAGNSFGADNFNERVVQNRDAIEAAGLWDTAVALLQTYSPGVMAGAGRRGLFFDMFPTYNDAGLNMAKMLGIPGFAMGGLVRGGIQNVDSIPAMLAPDEFIMRASAVRRVGVDTLETINQTGRIPANDRAMSDGKLDNLTEAVKNLTRIVAAASDHNVAGLAEIVDQLDDIASPRAFEARG
mgnify:CR=1 FL=1